MSLADMIKIAKHLYQWMTYNYDLVIHWEDKQIIHWCKDIADAHDWIAQYPKNEIHYRIELVR